MIDTEEYPVNLAAIKMMTQLVENSSNDAIVDFLPEMMPILLKVLLSRPASVADAWDRTLSGICLCVWDCVYIHAGKGKRLELSTLNLVPIYSMAVWLGMH